MKQCELLEKTVDDLDLSNIKVTQFKVLPVDFQTVKGFIKKWHYLGDAPLNISLVFGLYYKQNLIGAMIYGSLSMLNTYKKYGDSQDSIIELKRLCCIDKTKKNTESYFISKTLKFIKNPMKLFHVGDQMKQNTYFRKLIKFFQTARIIKTYWLFSIDFRLLI